MAVYPHHAQAGEREKAVEAWVGLISRVCNQMREPLLLPKGVATQAVANNLRGPGANLLNSPDDR
ncbi:hypothetical protein GCM10027594_20990 [Hymenobacter agri]